VSNTLSVLDTLNRMNNDTNRVQFEKGKQKLGTNDIGKDGFLQLMLAQMKFQNPLEPMDTSQQLLQQASFTQVEELQNLNASLQTFNELTQGTNLVGKSVQYSQEEGQATQSGIVKSLVLDQGKVRLEVETNGKLETIQQKQITKISAI
jgi:flagellar basal-body rod modification protein FlgD